ncbi:hypothetical protein [Micromonospora sp. WMMD710]|uniref:hypothetical protein n=1 Tax=Micromonospora sp. WMMD710 TaxID=3016085 RepID=UPI00241659D8|nr:hypothetical protein [Micromonospora sp. WMMD710]MDG4756393.1 hypothetical protein [Micromonospora sp. WMMD710]
MKTRSVAVTALALSLTASLAACVKSASYDERMEYLRTVAQRGADTHALIKSQESTIDKERCERAYEGLNDNDAPNVESYDNREGFLNQIKEFFVDSCVSGKPKPVPGDPIPSESSNPTAPSSSAPVPQASPST